MCLFSYCVLIPLLRVYCCGVSVPLLCMYYSCVCFTYLCVFPCCVSIVCLCLLCLYSLCVPVCVYCLCVCACCPYVSIVCWCVLSVCVCLCVLSCMYVCCVVVYVLLCVLYVFCVLLCLVTRLLWRLSWWCDGRLFFGFGGLCFLGSVACWKIFVIFIWVLCWGSSFISPLLWVFFLIAVLGVVFRSEFCRRYNTLKLCLCHAFVIVGKGFKYGCR